MRAGFNKWWLLPFGIFAASAVISLGIVVFEPLFIERTFARAPVECSGDLADDYACYQQRYQALVGSSGVKNTFDELKGEYEANEYVATNCHQITHVIGRAAADVYGDLSSTYGQGDSFCWSGYYHGAMEAIVAEIGPDQILEEAATICSDLGEDERYSFLHYNCVHGLGHGFMGIQQNELPDSLDTCDTLGDEWERGSCYSGVFMENVMAKDNPNHPSRYLDAERPLYPCTSVEERYKTECYKMQTSYALETQDGDFGKVFGLCAAVEDEHRPVCYQSLGRDASGQSVSDVEETNATCMRGRDPEARSNCVVGAVMDFVSYYDGDEEARELCDSFDEDADLRSACVETAGEYSESLKGA